MKRILCPTLLASFLLGIVQEVIAQPGQSGSFFNPPLGTNPSILFNPVWTLGQSQTIQWTTTLSNFTVFLYQQLGDNSATQGPGLFSKDFAALLLLSRLTTAAVLPGHESVTNFDWTVQTNNFDLNKSNVFFLWLQPGPVFNGGGMTSRFFNMSSSASSSSSTTASVTSSVSTPASTSTSAPLTTTTPTTSASASASSHDSTSSGLSSGTKVGLGLGITLGLVFLASVGAGGWYLLRKRKNKLRTLNHYPSPEPFSKPELPVDRAKYRSRHLISEMSQGEGQKLSELPGYRHVAELG